MKDRSNRRRFLKEVSLGGAMAFIPPGILKLSDDQVIAENAIADTNEGEKSAKRAYNAAYTGKYLNRVAFPIGGLGAGMFCLEGTGAISHVSVQNKPDIFNEPGMFAAIAVKGLEKGAKILEGPVPDW